MASTVDTSSYNQPAQPDAMAVSQNALGVANAAQGLKAGQFDLINKQYGVMHNILGSMVSDPDITTDKMMGGISQMAKLGLITPQMAATEGSSVYQTGGDPAKMKALAMSHLQQSMSGAQQFQNQYGTQQVDQGGVITNQRNNLVTGQMSPVQGGTFGKSLSPGELATPTNLGVVTAPNDPRGPIGTRITGTAADFINKTGGNNALFGGQPGVGYTPGVPQQPPGQGVAMPQPNALGVQPPGQQPAPQGAAGPAPMPRMPSATPQPAAPPATAPAAIAAAMPPQGQPAPAPVAPSASAPSQVGQGQGIVTGLAPGIAEAATDLAQKSSSQYATDLQDAKTLPQRIFPLQQAAGALARLGPQGTGPGTDTRNAVVSYVQSLPGIGKMAGIDPAKITDYDMATKYLNQYVLSQGGAGRSDLALSSSGSANANTNKISNDAAQEVVQNALALERMKSVAALNYAKQGGDPAAYLPSSAIKSQGLVPSAFAYDSMPPAQQAALITKLKADPKAMAAFVASHKAGVTAGVLGQ